MLGIYRLLFVTLCICPQVFCNGRGLLQGDAIWQDGRTGWVAGDILVNFGPRVSSKAKSLKNGNAHLVDRLRDRAEIFQDGGEAPAAGLRQV